MSKEDVLGFEIAVDDFVLLEEEEGVKHLLSEATDDFERKAAEGVGFDELVQIHVKELGGDAEMTSEIEGLSEADHAVSVFGVLVSLAGFYFVVLVYLPIREAFGGY